MIDVQMDSLQQIQDDEYSFPYHFVSQFKGDFTQCYYDNWGINYAATIEFILQQLKNEKFESIVDIGCGEGRLTQEIKNAFPSKKVLGIDYSTKAIALAKAMNPKGDYRQLNINEHELKMKYDVGILMEVFEHIKPEESEDFVESIVRVLVPKGKLLVTVPHINKEIEYKHYRHFSSQSLIKSFQTYFDVEEVVPFEKGKSMKRYIDKILGNKYFILNNTRLKNYIYNYYKNKLFYSSEKDCNRLYVKFIAK